MASRRSLHLQLSVVMETMAKCALNRVCELVDEDVAELRLSLSHLLVANSNLAEKVNRLECELTAVRRSDAPALCESYRGAGVQNVCHGDGDTRVSVSPSIEGIFGKDWSMDLWKDRDSPPQSSEEQSAATLLNHITVTQIKEEKDYVEDAASSCQQETLSTEERDESTAEEPEQSLGHSAGGGSTCGLSFDQDGEQVACAGGNEEQTSQLISISDSEEAFSTHTVPIEEEEEEEEEAEEEGEGEEYDDGVQFVEESQQKPTMHAEGGPRRSKRNTLPANNSEDGTAPDSLDDFNTLHVETARHPNKDKFSCEMCSITFFHKATLTKHMKCHKSHVCNICKRQFRQRYKFNTHACLSRLSSRKVSKLCLMCGKTFANLSALTIHAVVHTGEKPHRCSLCGKGFTQKGNLKCHLRLHSGEKPFRCVKCGMAFTQKVNLNHHLMARRNSNCP